MGEQTANMLITPNEEKELKRAKLIAKMEPLKERRTQILRHQRAPEIKLFDANGMEMTEKEIQEELSGILVELAPLEKQKQALGQEAAHRKPLRNSTGLKDAEKAMKKALHERHRDEEELPFCEQFFATLCPYLSPYKKIKLESEEDEERKMIDFLTKKLAKPPGDDDDTHIIDESHWMDWRLVYDEQDRPFWRNQKTGATQWQSPIPEDAKMKAYHDFHKEL